LVTTTAGRSKVKSVTKSNMASVNRRARKCFTAEEAAEICTCSDEESAVILIVPQAEFLVKKRRN